MRRYRSVNETRVSAAIRETLKASGLTLRAFADKLGISAAYLSDLSRGLRSLSVAQANRLSREKPRRSVIEWMLLQADDDIDGMRAYREKLASSQATR